MNEPVFRNFAYGSNMSLLRLRKRTPSARLIGIGKLEGHILKWHKASKDGSGKCDAQETGALTDIVWGAVFEIEERERAALNCAEGLGYGYDEKCVRILTAQGPVDAQVFYATRIESSLTPYDWYKQHVLRGARDLSLPHEYIAAITAVEPKEDPDAARVQRESRE